VDDYRQHRLAIAPMMDWTDRHCRFFHRQLTRRSLLYSEMIVADAILQGDPARLLAYSPEEHPLALQLGGSDPVRLARAAAIGADFGYDEINLNVGCPSDRVQSGTFGACLMREPALVGDCVAAMKAAVRVPVTVKCRLGVDEQDIEAALDALADAVLGAGADAIWVHARKAWLHGLSPKENRTLPPLDYGRVHRLKARLPDVFIGINGGLRSLDEALEHLPHVDGVMLGRAACETPMILAGADHRLYGEDSVPADPFAVAERMIAYAETECAKGTRIHHITRNMLGLFHGRPGARLWRQQLTVGAARTSAGPGIIRDALDAMRQATQRAERAAA
jgi:tRNA-dihydrouridine synthase A